MRLVLIAFSAVILVGMLSACSDSDVPNDVPRTTPPAVSVSKPIRIEQATPVVPLRRAPVQGQGPIFET